jgi:hypothetical protein
MNKINSGFCVVVMVLFMVTVLARIFTQNILMDTLNISNAFTRLVFFDSLPGDQGETGKPAEVLINWQELYPFEEDDTAKIFSVVPIDHEAVFRRLDVKTAWIRNKKNKLERYTRDWLVFRMNLVEMASRYEAVLGWNPSNVANVHDLGNGWITGYGQKKEVLLPDKNHKNTPVSALYEFDDFLKGLGIDLLYVQSPSKICENDSINGTLDFSNVNADELLYALSLKNIPHLDLRDVIHRENLDHHSLFYKTDHHWKTETALWAAGIIAGYLNAHNGFDIDLGLFSPDKYRYEVYKDWFLGSVGKLVTLTRAKPEDISLIYPLFHTDFVFQIPSLTQFRSKSVNKQGTFEVFYDYDHIRELDYYNKNPYLAYLYGDHPFTVIHNNLVHDEKKILFIKDSFGSSLAPFLALGVENMEIIDLRAFYGSLRSYIKQNRPDTVIVMYNPGFITGVIDYTSHGDLFDFR